MLAGVKVALAQINPTVGDFDGNAAKIRENAAEARRRGADLAVFPELSLCGYPPFDLVERPAFVQRNLEELERLAAETIAGADDGELFLEYSQSEALGFDDGKLKTASFDTSQGFGLRAIKGEAAGYAHASDLSEAAIRRAAW